jgi:Skp family chaperone for outer membrane proteins
MSNINTCPTCGSKSKIKVINGETTYQALQDEEVLKKVGQLKKAMQKFKEKAEALEKELEALKSKK